MASSIINAVTGKGTGDDIEKAGSYGLAHANQAAKDAWNYQQDALDPYQKKGFDAFSSIANNDFMKDWQTDPGYKFSFDEGIKAINNAASARGMGNSGATLKSLVDFSQNNAAKQYDNVYNRQYNRLNNLANVGLNTANTLSNFSGAYNNAIAGNYQGQANNLAGSAMYQGNKITDLINSGVKGGAQGFMMCDLRTKTNLQPVLKADLAEMRKHLKAYKFNYINDEHGKGDWIGVMAQDLEKSKLGKTLVVENEKGQKTIDVKKVISLWLATEAEG
jgi:hypothetical protein